MAALRGIGGRDRRDLLRGPDLNRCQHWRSRQLTQVRPSPRPLPESAAEAGLEGQWLLLSVAEGGYAHLFAFDLSSASLTRLTSGDQNDISPVRCN